MQRFLYLPINRPRTVLAALALLGALALFAQSGLRLDGRSENILPPTNPSVVAYDEFRRRFGTDEFVLLGLEAPAGRRMVDPEPYALLAELTERVRAVADVDRDRVFSLATVRLPTLTPAFPRPRIEFTPLVSAPPRDAAAADAIAERLQRLPLLQGFVISEDLRTGAVLAILKASLGKDAPGGRTGEDPAALARAVRSIQEIAAELAARSGIAIHVGGTPVVKTAFISLLAGDMAVLVPLSTAIVGAVLLLLFRSWRGLVLPLASVVLAILGTTAFMAAAGYAINTVTSLLPPLILSAAIGESVHLISAWDHLRRRPGADPIAAVRAAVEEAFLPCALTSFTTVAGFLSLAAAPIRPIGEFGIFASLGTVFAFLLTFTLVPAVLCLLPARATPADPPATPATPGPQGAAAAVGPGGCAEGGGRVGRLLGAMAGLIVRRPRLVLAVSAVPVVLALAATAAWLEVEVDFVGYFKQDHPVAAAARFFTERLSGPAPLEVVIDGPAGAFRAPENLRRLADLQGRLERLIVTDRHGRPLDAVDRTVSLADFVKSASRLEGGAYEVPLDARRIAAYELLAPLAGGCSGLDQFVTPDGGAARIMSRMKNVGSQEAAALVTATHVLFREVFAGDPAFKLTVTGAAVIFLEVAQTVAEGQISSFGSALLLVFGSMLLLFRSLRFALASIIPNLFPIVFTFGFMAVTGITLNMSTAMVASIAIGIAVDDTIHFLTSFRRNVEATGDAARAVTDTFETVGPANFAMTLILCAGFGVSVLASFYPTIHFGVLSAVTIAIAFYGDFVLLPAILVLAWPGRAPATLEAESGATSARGVSGGSSGGEPGLEPAAP